MTSRTTSRRLGFVLIEALIALLLIGVGLLAVSKLQSMSVASAGESKSRTEAANLTQKKTEELRNILLKSGFTALASNAATVAGSNATYTMTWSVSTPNSALEQRLLQISTTWTDQKGAAQKFDLNTLIAWDDPGSQAKLGTDTSGTLISPTGQAQRGTGSLSPTLGTANPDGSRLYIDEGSKITYLMSSTGTVLLSLPPKGNVAQAFTTITGRILFDENAGNNQIPSSSNVRVRLSSEGECIYNNANNQLTAVSGGSNAYKFFTYRCYVGPDWYGNVGVTVDESVSGNAGSPTVCVGDPGFNNAVSNSTLISAHPVEASLRSYRGFRGTAGSYRSTGMASGSRYGKSTNQDGTDATGPFNGKPVPSDYPSFYPSVSAALNYFNQDFLITNVGNNSSCASKMTGGVFARNAGKYVCINPDNASTTDDVCPPTWPGFEGEVGTGGSINFSLAVTRGGTGTGAVTSSPAAISCGATCSGSFASGSTVTLTALAASGSTFTGWSGCTTTSGTTCTVTITSGTTVLATFDTVAPSLYTLAVVKAGSGSGTVSSSPSGINCGTSCSASFTAGTSVTLTAVADAGSTFAGWSGACSGTGTCTVPVNSNLSATATFSSSVSATQTLTVSKAGTGTGTVSSSPAGISCGATCSASFTTGTSVTLTAAPGSGSTFTGWAGACSGTGACTVALNSSSSVTATFTAVTYTLSVTNSLVAGGTVTSSAGGINCGATCSASFASGASVSLTASPTAGYSFSGWSGACSGTGACTVTMAANTGVTATFVQNTTCSFAISGTTPNGYTSSNSTLSVSPSSTGTCAYNGNATFSCSITAASGTVVSITTTKSNASKTVAVPTNCQNKTNITFP